MADVVVSGIKPTGTPHLGNYLGAFRQWLELEKKHTCFFFIADLHALTEEQPNPNPDALRARTLDVGRTMLALGLDPKRVTFFAQSHVTGHTELAWIFNCMTSVGNLERMTQYKDAKRAGLSNNAGLFDYPVLQAADILLYKGSRVPVGEDQVQHVELTRDTARTFNRSYPSTPPTFPETKPLLTKTLRVMSLEDPAMKMSKRIGRAGEPILLTDAPEVITKKFRSAVTATTGGGESPGVANLFLLLEAFADAETVRRFRGAEGDGSIRYTELKSVLAEKVTEHFAEFRTRYAGISDDEVVAVLKQGAAKAQSVADQTIREVREKVGLLPLR